MSSPSPGPSAEVPFTPRKEFIRESSNQPNSFALLALSGPNCIRLYSFVHLAVASIRRLLEQRSLVISSREDTVQNFYEFVLDAKPWANPKSVPTEKLIVDIMAVVYHCGYTYLSLIDYGREPDDRLVMTFCKPSTDFRSPSPFSSSSPPKVDSSTSLLGNKVAAKRVPFAISFSSVTIMRVISPPLHLTPAILQAVRASWPRGVVAEKKVGENSYEFKLKGYKWFQPDTFATDSLRHILSLLSSLDAHSFTLLTSISLTNRSRVKDLWIFTGPALEGETLPSDHASDIHHGGISNTPDRGRLSPENQHYHQRHGTDPPPVIPHSPVIQHPRASTESPTRPRLSPSQGQVLRKPAPRAQIPVSVVHDPDTENPDETNEVQPIHAHMPSTISDSVENMTGVGASPNIFYSTSPFQAAVSPSPNPVTITSPLGKDIPMNPRQPSPIPPSERLEAQPVSDTSSSLPQQIPSPNQDQNQDRSLGSSSNTPAIPSMTSPFLGMGAFRDSELSSQSEVSYEIPIKWTGPLQEELAEEKERPKLGTGRHSSGPNLPGAWQPSPIAEKPDQELASQMAEEKKNDTTPIHELGSRFDAPQVVRPDVPLRKSEAALVGIIHSTSPPPPVPSPDKSAERSSSAGGQGWVLVSVDNGKQSPAPPDVPEAKEQQSPPSSTPVTTASPKLSKEPQYEQASPTAKAIVIIDALDSKNRSPRSIGQSSSGVRRFFSLSKKNSVSVTFLYRSIGI
ncbi:hypothetical protein CVT26_007595 [Gymnopilus dilepis]|uniref:Uncharacterized protein n=1 Tax=Gymnopilus dilepis TaxID=231916 RepID=A0A409VZS1_9AGAR|nr:hypothetical protein CVT26_007595 [Gymnopilus dilepis]